MNHPYIVVGSGFGGLAAAVRLRAKGHPVLVLEANEQPGGRASVWRRDGYTFDAGPTVITAPHLLDELFTLLGRDPRDYYTLDAVDPFYRVLFHDGSRFDYVGDDERLLAQIEAMSPRDVDGYRTLVKQAQAIFDVGYTQLADRPFHEVGAMLRVVPDMLRLGSYRSVYGMVASHIRDERLRQALTFEPLLIGGNPFTAPSIYLLIHWLKRKWGVWFPRGGTGAVVAAIARMLDEVGVEVRCNSAVSRVLVEGGRAVGVELADGRRIAAAGVVYNGDPSFAYSKLLDKAERPSWSDRAVARVKPSMSLFVSYFGTEGTNTMGSNTAGANTAAAPAAASGPWPSSPTTPSCSGRATAGSSTTSSRRRCSPTTCRSTCTRPPAPIPRSRLPVMTPSTCSLRCPTSGSIPLGRLPGGLPGQGDGGARAAGAPGAPGAGQDAVLGGIPRYFEGRLRTVDGAAFGPEPILTQSAWFRYHNASQDVGGLYFVGAGTHPGAGVPGVLNSAKVLDRVVEAPVHALAVNGARSVA